jgi:hypothetical protein
MEGRSSLTERTHDEAKEHYRQEEKLAIPRRHLVEKEPISKLCDEMGLGPQSSQNRTILPTIERNRTLAQVAQSDCNAPGNDAVTRNK